MSAALKLEIFQNGELLREVPFDGPDLWLGRGDECVIRLDDRAISRKHALIRGTQQGLEVEKKSKFGGVKVNGKEAEHSLLKNGDRLELGPYEIRVKQEMPVIPPPPQTVIMPPPPPEVEVPTIQLDPETRVEGSIPEMSIGAESPIHNMGFEQPEGVEPISTGDGSGSTGAFDFAKEESDGNTRVFNNTQKKMKAVLQFGDGAANVTHYEITEDDKEIAIGRSQRCNVVLEDKRSSRKHSLIKRVDDKLVLKDLGSANGTLVNGEKVDEHELQSGDVIQIGDTQFAFKLLQEDYELKKEEFIQVKHEEPQEMPVAEPLPPMMQMDMSPLGYEPYHADPGAQPAFANPTPAPDFSAPPEEKKSIIGKFLDRYRAMNTKQQIIYGAAILAAVYFLLDEEPEKKTAKLNTGNVQTKVVQKKEKKPGSGQTFDSLTPEQQRYIETQYQIAFDMYKSREYDNALLEVGKIFSLVQEYKNAREIENFAREGKRKLEAQEEERKKKELEKQAQLKLQSLLEQAGMLMDKKRFKEAEALFPEIELIQPENAAVSEWRKQMIAENEKLENEQSERKKREEANKSAWAEFQKVQEVEKSDRWEALDQLDVLMGRQVEDKKFIPTVKSEIKKIEDAIDAELTPVLAQAKALEQEGKNTEAYRAYQKALEIDPSNTDAPEGMKRIRGTLAGRAKSIYAEGVFAESYSDVETAEKRYREVMEVVPTDDDYYLKAESRLKKLTILRRPASEETPQ